MIRILCQRLPTTGAEDMRNSIAFEKKMRKRGWKLCWAGWAGFALSLLLPALNVLGWTPGWACLIISLQMGWEFLTGHGSFDGELYYVGIAVINVFMLASPL